MVNTFKKLLKRTVAFVLCAILLLGAVPIDILPKAAGYWADPYMNQMKAQGIMTDGRPSAQITRAEMAAVLQRAFGFTRTGPIPFTDVSRSAWFYNAISICYNEGILTGVTPTRAAPTSPLTREQALVLIARCLRYEANQTVDETFSDYKSFGNYSAKYVESALMAGIIGGFPDGSFQPKKSVTRGEIAKMMSIAIGVRVSSPGVTELGGVFGNVTVNSPNVTLRNTTIAGNLYLTGGIELGNVILDNVKVLGNIIVAGGGEVERGEASVQLNNVTANKMIIDPATGQYVSLRALGNTDIPETIVRSEAYIQDDVRNNYMGLQTVIFEKPASGTFTISGNMKDVTLKTPNSLLKVGDTGTGSVTNITVDEHATNSRVDLEVNANVDKIKLDAQGATVTGTGDIGNLSVGAANCSSEILPNTVEVRPGITTEIAGIPAVDNKKAQELSEDPMLLEGYPKVKNITPTTADVYFSTNRPGKLYWALTDAATGPLTDSDVETLIDQPSYASGFLKAGSFDIDDSHKDFKLELKDKNLLTQGGTYYISAVLTEPGGQRRNSPVKSQRFVTPDGTKPAMASTSYPSINDLTPTRNEENAGLDFSEIADLQALVMANKNCDLYYILLPSGSAAPTSNELLSGAYTNPYGYGRLHLLKNTLDSFRINEVYDVNDLDGNYDHLGALEEKKSYDLYYWLTDGAQSSNVTKYKSTITTKDITPPEFTLGEMYQSSTAATSVTLSNAVNEKSTIYWVAVPSGSAYPKHDPDVYPNTDAWRKFLKEDRAKIQITAGVGISGSKSGKVTSNSTTGAFDIKITGLQRESAYDVYYLAQDDAKNYSPIFMYTAHTLDETPPTASLRFESFPEESPETPYAYSTIDVVFSEAVRYRQPSNSPVMYSEVRLMELYNNYKNASQAELKKAEDEYVGALKDAIILRTSTGSNVAVRDWDRSDDTRTDWVVDYRNVQVHQEGTKMVVRFVNNPNKLSESALNLESGAQYYFRLQNIADDSQSRNSMVDYDMNTFTTVSARIGIRKLGDLELKAFKVENDEISSDPVYVYNDMTTKVESTRTDKISADIAFTATPDSTSTTAADIKWDMILWFDTDVEFMLFTRVHGSNDGWIPVGGVDEKGDPKTLSITAPYNTIDYTGTSVVKSLTGNGTNSTTPQYHDINEPYKLGLLGGGLNDSDGSSYDFALYFTKIGGRSDRASFDQKVTGQVTFVTGDAASLSQFSPANIFAYNSLRSGNALIADVTWPNKDSDLTNPATRLLTKQFVDGRAPIISNQYPRITPTSSGADVRFAMSGPGTIYYVLAPMTTGGNNFVVTPQKTEGNKLVDVSYEDIEAMIPKCETNGPVGHQYTMASDLSVMERMFPDDFLLNGSPNSGMSGYKFDSPVYTNITNNEFSEVASKQLIAGSVEANKAENSFTLSGLAPDTEYLMYLVTTSSNSSVYSPVTVYRFKTEPTVKPIITTQATGASATINSDQPDTNIVYKLIPYDNTRNPLFREQFAKDGYVTSAFDSYKGKSSPTQYIENTTTHIPYDSSQFTVLNAMIETVTVGGKQQSLFDVCASAELKQAVANIIDGTVPDGGSSLGKVENVIRNGSISFMCDDVWKDMGNGNYCLIVYGYCGPKTNNMPAEKAMSFSAAKDIKKRRAQIQVEIGNGLYYDATKPTISGTLVFNFTDALYAYEDSTGTKTAICNTPKLSSNPTGNPTQSIQNYLTVSSSVVNNVEYLGASENNKSALRSVSLEFTNVGSSIFTVTLQNPAGSLAGENTDPREGALQLRVSVTNNKLSVTAISGKDWLKTPIVN